MKITTIADTGLDHHYSIVVAADAVEAALCKQLESISKKAKIPGFRAGKIPMPVLKQRYGKEVMDEVLWNSVNDATRSLLSEKALRPALKPEVVIKEYAEGGDLSFDLKLQIMPEAPEIPYDKIAIPAYRCEVTDEEVAQGIARLSASKKHFHAAKEGKKAAIGDAVKIDFLGKLDGVPFDGGKGEGFQLELGSGQFIPGFEDQLVGAKAGDERVINVTFPESYHSSQLAGKAATFDVTVHSVLEAHTPEADDALANDFGFESLDKLKDAVRAQITDDFANLARNKAKRELFDWLDANLQFDVPSKMKELEFNGIWEQMQRAKAQGDSTLDKPEDELRAEYEAVAERRVRLGILLAEVGRLNNLQVTKDELTRAVMQQARMFPGQEQKVFEFYQKNPDQADELRGPIIEDKAVDFILGKLTRTEKLLSMDELLEEEKADADADSGSEKPKKSSKKKA
jgi:trigger factor